MNTIHRNLDSLTEFATDGIVSKSLYEDDQKKCVLFCMRSGQELSEHTATKAAWLHFKSGTGTLTLGSTAVDIQPDLVVHMQPGELHSIKTTSDLVFYLILFKP